jgi:lantibiotic biosynthesis protein
MTTRTAGTHPAGRRARAAAQAAYRPLAGLVVRAPLLPATHYEQLGTGTGGSGGAWDDPGFRFAVSVASPDLAAALSVPGGAERSPARARAALQRYLIRACLRPTPFGGFAAVAIGRWADSTSLRIAPGRWPTRTRPDMGWLTAVAQRLASDPGCRPGLRVFANACAFERAGRIYLTDQSTGGVRDGPDVSVRATALVRGVLARARPGIGLAELRNYVLGSSPHATAARADLLLDQLCRQQFLVPEVLPALTADPLGHVIRQLAGVPAAASWANRLSAIGAECGKLDAAGPAAAADALPALRAQMRTLASSLETAEPAGPLEPLQVDSALPLLGTGVSRRIADDLACAADVLLRLHPSPYADKLADYRAEFHHRYGDGRRVPLLELLDPRFGLGPPGLRKADWPAAHLADSGAAARQAAHLQNLAAAAIRDGCREVVLDPGLIRQLATWVPDPQRLPASLELSAFVAAASPASVDRGDYLLVLGPNLGAAAAGRGLGRFADLLGPAAQALLQEAADAEQDSSRLVAELVYRPVRSRAANVAVRPVVRAFEIPVGVAPSLPPDAVIRPDELSVLLRDGRLRLWWERAGQEVGVAAGHMLNAAAAPPLCQQLIELASDGTTSLFPFSWGPLASMPFLPRVRSGRVVLHPAQWRLGPVGEDGLNGAAGRARFGALLASCQDRWRLPRHVYLTWADNRLLLDLDDAGHREQLRTALTRPARRAAVLQEALPGPADAWLAGPGGRHVVELVVPMARDRRITDRPGRRGQAGAGLRGRGNDGSEAVQPMPQWPEADRIRPPGSDWLYLALCGPRSTEDALLVGSLGALVDRLVEQGDADGWFFVRYNGPEPQLRLRAHGAPAALTERVLPALMRWGAQAIAQGIRTRLSLQAYERELERYGGPATTGLCERIACLDSRAVRQLLAIPEAAQPPQAGEIPPPPAGGPGPAALADRGGPACPGDRLELALVSTADLLQSIALDPAEQVRLCKAAAGNAAGPGALFRVRQARLRALIAAVPGHQAAGAADYGQSAQRQCRDVLADRRVALAPLLAELDDRHRDGSGLLPVGKLAPSLMHLHANRLGLDRASEQLMFGLLERTLRSVRAYPVRQQPGIGVPG